MLAMSMFDVIQWIFQCQTKITFKRKTEIKTHRTPQIISFHYIVCKRNRIFRVWPKFVILFFSVRFSGLFILSIRCLYSGNGKENQRLSSFIRYSWETSKRMARLTFKWAQTNMPKIPNDRECPKPNGTFRFEVSMMTIYCCCCSFFFLLSRAYG